MEDEDRGELLQLHERVMRSLALGESQFREFKSAWEGPPAAKKPRDARSIAKDIGETLVAFANADGGVLLVGVEDDGTITGFSYSEDTLRGLSSAPTNNVHPSTPLPTPVVRQLHIGPNRLLYFAVEKSTRLVHQTSDGKCIQRRDLQNLPIAFDQLQFERQEQLSREYDRSFVDGATPLDLDLDLVKGVSDHITKGMSPEKCLQFLGLADYKSHFLQLRRASMLLFARDIKRWHPRCEVRILRVRGTELKTGREYNALSDETSTGNVIQLLTLAWEKLRPHLVETKLAPDALFKERVMYPEDACREALINAIAHRDYGMEGRGIEIFIFDDRMEVQSPGGLLSTVKVEELKKLQGLHQSRNALVARTLREVGYMREMGEGVRRIFKLMSEADLVAPELRSELGTFGIVLSHKSVFSDADQRWLDGFRSLRLTREEMLVALLGRDGQLLSAQKVYDTLGLVDWDVYRVIVDQMKSKGILFNTKPKSGKRRGRKAREIPRLAILPPDQIERDLNELLAVCGRIGQFEQLRQEHALAILQELGSANVYRSNPPEIEKTLRVLDVIDEGKRPREILRGIWRARAADSASAQGNAERNASARPTAPCAVASSVRRESGQDGRWLFVGNVAAGISEGELRDVFETCGAVSSIRIPRDRDTGQSKGFAFVMMGDDGQAAVAIARLAGRVLGERSIRVELAARLRRMR